MGRAWAPPPMARRALTLVAILRHQDFFGRSLSHLPSRHKKGVDFCAALSRSSGTPANRLGGSCSSRKATQSAIPPVGSSPAAMWELYIAAASVRGARRCYVGIADDAAGGVDTRLGEHQAGWRRGGAAWLRPHGQDAPTGTVERDWRLLRRLLRRLLLRRSRSRRRRRRRPAFPKLGLATFPGVGSSSGRGAPQPLHRAGPSAQCSRTHLRNPPSGPTLDLARKRARKRAPRATPTRAHPHS